MVRKNFIFTAAILLLVFSGITIIKYLQQPGDHAPLSGIRKSDAKQSFWAYYNLATEYRLQDKTDASIRAYQEALKLNPDHEDARYYIGNMYRKTENFDKARESWEKLIELNAQSERAYNQLGNLYFSEKHPAYFHPEKSKWYFKQAARLNNLALNPNLGLAEIALFQDSTEVAREILDRVSVMDPKNAEVFFILGYLDWKSGNEQPALGELKRSLELGIKVVFTNELGATATPASNTLSAKNQEYDLVLDWLTKNLTIPKKDAISSVMPKLYRKFDQYLIQLRKQLNHD